MKKIFMYPGQGSQKKGMGGELFEKESNLTKKASEILGYDIRDLCLNDPDNNINNTQYTQPALFTVEVMMYKDAIRNANQEEKPAAVLGHSLGEYSALYSAGVFDFETGLKIVAKRGEIMSSVKNGSMAAVLGLSTDVIRKITDEKLKQIDVANFNCPGQIVLSGPEEAITKSENIFKENGAKRFVKLSVSGAFHSRYMEEPATQFAEFLNDIPLNAPKIPVFANCNAEPYPKDPKQMKNNMINQMKHSVLWESSLRNVSSSYPDCEFVEIGPGNVLKGLLRKTL